MIVHRVYGCWRYLTSAANQNYLRRHFFSSTCCLNYTLPCPHYSGMVNNIRLPLPVPNSRSFFAYGILRTEHTWFVACQALSDEHSGRRIVLKFLYFRATRRQDAEQKTHPLCTPFCFVGKRGACHHRAFQEAEYHPAVLRSNHSF